RRQTQRQTPSIDTRSAQKDAAADTFQWHLPLNRVPTRTCGVVGKTGPVLFLLVFQSLVRDRSAYRNTESAEIRSGRHLPMALGPQPATDTHEWRRLQDYSSAIPPCLSVSR